MKRLNRSELISLAVGAFLCARAGILSPISTGRKATAYLSGQRSNQRLLRRFLLIGFGGAALIALATCWSLLGAGHSNSPVRAAELHELAASAGVPLSAKDSGAADAGVETKPGRGFFDPLEITPCHLNPLAAQDVSSQVDGIFEEILVDVGSHVRKGELLGRLDDRQLRAQMELLAIRAASDSAERIAKAQFDDADARVQAVKKVNDAATNTVTDLETKMYFFQRERFAFEMKKAREDQDAAKKELEKTKVVLDQFTIRSGIAGEVVKVYKRTGETVKQGEPLFRVANCNSLRVEGLCKIQQANLVRVGMRTLVEPEIRGQQMTQLIGHTGAITALAISTDGRLLASAGEDRNVFLWKWPEGTRAADLTHDSDVTAVAFKPTRGNGYTLLTGCGDGRGHLWNVPIDGKPSSTALPQQHEGPIRAVAFSADGTRCATAGDDKRIAIWDAAAGMFLFWLRAEDTLSAHQGAITSLRFCPDGLLVSAGRDNVVKVWQLNGDSGSLLRVHTGRTCEVAQLGVSTGGRRLLLDLGEELRIVDRDSGAFLGSLHGRRQGRFQGLAVFSPSGRLVLTASSNQHLQLWRVPPTAEETAYFRQGYANGFHLGSLLRMGSDLLGLPAAPYEFFENNKPRLWNLAGCEVRHYLIPTASIVNAGVFAPDESAFFTGGTDKIVRVWAAPAASQWQPSYEATVTYVGSQVEPGTDMVRIRAELENPAGVDRRLRAGMFATLRIFPETADLK